MLTKVSAEAVVATSEDTMWLQGDSVHPSLTTMNSSSIPVMVYDLRTLSYESRILGGKRSLFALAGGGVPLGAVTVGDGINSHEAIRCVLAAVLNREAGNGSPLFGGYVDAGETPGSRIGLYNPYTHTVVLKLSAGGPQHVLRFDGVVDIAKGGTPGVYTSERRILTLDSGEMAYEATQMTVSQVLGDIQSHL